MFPFLGYSIKAGRVAMQRLDGGKLSILHQIPTRAPRDGADRTAPIRIGQDLRGREFQQFDRCEIANVATYALCRIE